MKTKRFVLGLCTIVGISFICTGCWIKKENAQNSTVESAQPIINEDSQKPKVQSTKLIVHKTNLYSSTPYDIPLYSIIEISKLPEPVQKAIDKILENSQGFYFLKKENGSVLILLQNPISHIDTYSRHDLQFAEVDMSGNIHYHTVGYSGINGEISNAVDTNVDEWIFDESVEPKRPVKHTSFDENGHIIFVENWNYNENEQTKYQMKNSQGKIISILKESQDGDSNYRKEHVFYDNDGRTTMSLSVNYDGASITGMTFYSAQDSADSMSIVSEYNNGLKTKELIYNTNYELTNTVTSDYNDSERKSITLYDSEGNEINKIYN